ncbi:hypothetical protein H5410_038882 [Solanum commersonii]|uniref:Uncharacterized protein n=1 Tax=Solanum commersonii TaxID=4109 RepID=A0A9J5YBV9_SOLCO|nr:hypothetical protein H5410_038882 [Solanum commersonii]
MGKKRKSLASSLDEAMNQQKLSFLSSERHGMIYGSPRSTYKVEVARVGKQLSFGEEETTF